MKQTNRGGVAAAVFLASLLALAVLLVLGRDTPETRRLRILCLLLATAALLVLAGRGRRLSVLCSLAVCALGGFALGWLGVPSWAAVLLALAVLGAGGLAVYAVTAHRLRSAAERLNAAARAYQETGDAGAYLAALDACARKAPRWARVTFPGAGSIPFRDYAGLLKARVLRDQGQTEAYQAQLDQLAEQTGCLRFLDLLEQEDAPPAP